MEESTTSINISLPITGASSGSIWHVQHKINLCYRWVQWWLEWRLKDLIDHGIQVISHLWKMKSACMGRTYFNETHVSLAAKKLCAQACPHLACLGESCCYLSLASCWALIRNVEYIYYFSFTPLSLRIHFQTTDAALFLNMAALEALEVGANTSRSISVCCPSWMKQKQRPAAFWQSNREEDQAYVQAMLGRSEIRSSPYWTRTHS